MFKMITTILRQEARFDCSLQFAPNRTVLNELLQQGKPSTHICFFSLLLEFSLASRLARHSIKFPSRIAQMLKAQTTNSRAFEVCASGQDPEGWGTSWEGQRNS